MKKKIQVFLIHGGMTFKTKKDYLHYLKTREILIKPKIKWGDEYLKKKLGRNFEIIKPRMPLQDNAKYKEWKIYFERFFPYLRNNIILIGASLGVICPPFDDTIPTEDLAGGFKLKSDLFLIKRNSKNLNLLFSKDDDIVPVSHAKKYKNKLKNAKIIIYKSKNGHFKISKFPEIIKMIKSDTKRLS